MSKESLIYRRTPFNRLADTRQGSEILSRKHKDVSASLNTQDIRCKLRCTYSLQLTAHLAVRSINAKSCVLSQKALTFQSNTRTQNPSGIPCISVTRSPTEVGALFKEGSTDINAGISDVVDVRDKRSVIRGIHVTPITIII